MTWGAIGGAAVGVIGSTIASNKDRDASAGNQGRSQQFLEQASTQARADAGHLFGEARTARTAGFDTARDIFQQFVPQQLDAFQQGNFQAQQTAGATPQQQMNAILGRPVDFSFLQPQQAFQPDFSFMDFETPIPEVAPTQREEETAALTNQTDDEVFNAYRQYLGREPDPSGLAYFRNIVNDGGELAKPSGVNNMIREIQNSSEGQAYANLQNAGGTQGFQGFGQLNQTGGLGGLF